MLIRNVRIRERRHDVRLAGDRIAAIGRELPAVPGEPVFDGRGGAMLPGLHDHHIHLNATAAALASLHCGPPDIGTRAALAMALRGAPGEGWLRGIGYHQSIGAIDRGWLDRHGPGRPIRIQHRSGRMWILNSAAMAALELDGPPDGRLIDEDAVLRTRLRQTPPSLTGVGRMLARRGITGVTDATHRNGEEDHARLATAGLDQRILMMGDASLDHLRSAPGLVIGPVKFHFHDHDLPPLDSLAAAINQAHAAGRAVAAHCVTRAELALYLAALEEAGARRGDRIEHGGVIPPEFIRIVADLGLTVVSQPHFLVERGDAYRRDVDPNDLPCLYPLAALRRAGVPIAAGSDAPFGGSDPWSAMAAAVARPQGFGLDAGLDAEAALALFTGGADAPGGPPRIVRVGEVADLCVIDRDWAAARRDLATVQVRLTIVGGRPIYRSIESTNPHPSASDAGTRRIESAI
ncbi:amidohydrolase family protein [Sphingomonas sp.]|uniref:amidohydrolase family protein n=1 Tax=Sphingomonas sp. TaxID=28214 RepID=UPI003B00C994